MIKALRHPRLVPVVLVAAGGLFVLKVAGIIINGGYTLGAGHMAETDRIIFETQRTAHRERVAVPDKAAPPAVKQSWAQEVFNFPEITGSVGAKPKPDAAKEKDAKPEAGKSDAKDGQKPEAAKAKPAESKPAEPKPAPDGKSITVEAKPLSTAERALLERLQERRQELDQRERELDMRETLLQSAQKRLDDKLSELKDIEERIKAASQRKDETEVSRLKGLVTMYESMKAKDAAKIFDRLDMKILVDVAKQINPRRMSDIMAQMQPEAAERLTVELAGRREDNANTKETPEELPKIEGSQKGT